MEAVKIVEQYWEQLKRLGVYAQYCAGNDLHAIVCHDFWIWSVVALIGIGALVTLLCAKTLIKDQLEFRRNRKRLEARTIVADAETIAAARWKGEDGADVELSHEDLAAKMRAAIDARAVPAGPSPKADS